MAREYKRQRGFFTIAQYSEKFGDYPRMAYALALSLKASQIEAPFLATELDRTNYVCDPDTSLILQYAGADTVGMTVLETAFNWCNGQEKCKYIFRSDVSTYTFYEVCNLAYGDDNWFATQSSGPAKKENTDCPTIQ